MPPLGVYQPEGARVLTMLVGTLAMQQTHAFSVRLLFVLY
jgi:hypothetical protein